MDEPVTQEPVVEKPVAATPPPTTADGRPRTDVVPPAQPDEGEVDPDGQEPGGDDPQAVRARKEYRAKIAAKKEAAQQREENIRLQERLRTIEEERKKPAAPEKIYTIAEINAAVDAGHIARADADKYIEEVIVPRRVESILEQHEARTAKETPIKKAKQEIGEYLKFIPSLNDRTSPEFRKVADKYLELTNDGLPQNDVTERLAVEMVHGSLDVVRKKRELANLNAEPRTIPSDTGGGGQARPGGKIDISRAPASMVTGWDREGADQATRERRYKIYLDLKARQNGR